MNNKIEEALEELKEEKKPFSLFTLAKKYNISEEDLKKDLKNIITYDNLNTFVFVYCTNCNKKVYDIEYNDDFFKKNLTCYKCKEKFKPSLENSQYTFDFRTLKERFKSS